jgi:hypothetical protein
MNPDEAFPSMFAGHLARNIYMQWSQKTGKPRLAHLGVQ